MWRKGNPSALLVGTQTGAATVESRMEFPQKIKNETALWSSDPTFGDIFKETQNSNSKDSMHPVFIAALFTIAKIWKQPKCPSVDEWVKKLWYFHTVEYYWAVKKKKKKKKKEILPFATAWMDLEIVMLSEINQLVKDNYHKISLTWGI